MKKQKRIMIDYRRNENSGGIHNLTDDGYFTAFTEVQSKKFKTLKGAQKFMEKWGYIPIETTFC